MAFTQQEEQLLQNNIELVSICRRLSEINTEQNRLLRQEVETNTRLSLYCTTAYKIISQKQIRTAEENHWLKAVREELK